MGDNKKCEAQELASKLAKLQGQRTEKPDIDWQDILKILFWISGILRSIRSLFD